MEIDSETPCVIAESLRMGDEGTLKQLFNLLYDPLLYFATKHVSQVAVAEEAVADSFYKLWAKREAFMHIGQIKSYLYVCTRNACLQHIRNAKTAPVPENLDALADHIEHDHDLLDRIIRTEVIDQIYRYVNDLPEKQRNVFKLFFIEELSLEEISRRLDISLPSVYAHKSRAVAHLRRRSLANADFYLVLFLFLQG